MSQGGCGSSDWIRCLLLLGGTNIHHGDTEARRRIKIEKILVTLTGSIVFIIFYVEYTVE
jgi:hypothetical protein